MCAPRFDPVDPSQSANRGANTRHRVPNIVQADLRHGGPRDCRGEYLRQALRKERHARLVDEDVARVRPRNAGGELFGVIMEPGARIELATS